MSDNNIVPSRREIEATQFAHWYSRESLARKSFKSCVVDLSASFVSYLGEDGIIVPPTLGGDGDDDDGFGDYSDMTDEQSKMEEERNRSFTELHSAIKGAIAKLEGAVFPKLNWSCPLDASWMNAGSLKCFHAQDIIILLKASDRISYDLNYMLPEEETAEASLATGITLVLRKWANLNPSMEFRFFVRNRKLVGLCQRDTNTFYDFLAVEDERDRLESLLLDFYYDGGDTNHYTRDEVIRSSSGLTLVPFSFPSSTGGEREAEESWLADELGVNSFTVDVYVDKADRVWIVDFNTYGHPTDALLYTFEELDQVAAATATADVVGVFNPSAPEMVSCEVSLKVVSSEMERTVKRRVDLSSNTGPIDVTEAPDFNQFIRVLEQQRREEGEEDCS